MFFGFGRRIRRRLLWCLVLVLAVLFLKEKYPEFGARIGNWVSGTKDSPIVRAVSSMVESLSGGEDVKTAVEVFRENIEVPENT